MVAKIVDEAWAKLVEQGLAILNSKGQVLRRGFSTGTTAAGRARRRSCPWTDRWNRLDHPSQRHQGGRPGAGQGRPCFMCNSQGIISTIPSPARSSWLPHSRWGEGVQVIPGEGIGEYVRTEGTSKVGSPAISPSASGSIILAVSQAKEEIGIRGVRVELQVLDGEKIAMRR